MSGMLHPVGPEDPQVYWMRRATIGVVVLVVVLIIVAFARPPKTAGSAIPAGSPTPLVLSTPTPTPTPTPTESPAPAAATPTPGASPAAAQTPAAAKTPDGTAACQASDIRVALSGGSGAGIGQQTTFTVQLTNGSSSPCRIGVDKSLVEMKIVSGSDRIWSTADCDGWLPTKSSAEVKAGESLSVDVGWPGRRSYPGCKLGSKAISAGTYVVTAEYQGAGTAKKVIGLK
ncbi:hypothetical protein [Raineyella sp.]|uniref:hypothetical protein n=1 Tax=Raineyella sp. TaxID=1911550 RepID=UPI002B20E260|nr:hypothetical protein [Raineyella sp.]MEA5155455.1 hypothetical protein [Raineyella sp.]